MYKHRAGQWLPRRGVSGDLVIGLGASCTRAHLVILPPARYTSHLYALLQVNTGAEGGERQRLYRGKSGSLQKSVCFGLFLIFSSEFVVLQATARLGKGEASNSPWFWTRPRKSKEPSMVWSVPEFLFSGQLCLQLSVEPAGGRAYG